MKIWHVHVSSRLGPVNGVVQSIHRLADAQREAGMEVQTFHGTTDDPMAGPTSGSGRGLARELRDSAATAPPDVIHVHELFRPPHLVLNRSLRTTPYVISTHGATAPDNLARYRLRKQAWSRAVDHRTAARASALVALTAAERADLQRWLPHPPQIWTIPNAADPELLALPPWRPLSASRPALVSLSRWDVRHKGLDRMAAVAVQLPDVTFRVHGSRCGNEERRLAELEATKPPNLELAAPVGGQARTTALRDARGFVLLSRWEGLSMALLEAMALGVACFTSPEVAATLDGGDGATIVVPEDPAAAARTIDAALADLDRLAAVGAAGRRWVEERAAPSAVATATLGLYGAVTGRARERNRVLAHR